MFEGVQVLREHKGNHLLLCALCVFGMNKTKDRLRLVFCFSPSEHTRPRRTCPDQISFGVEYGTRVNGVVAEPKVLLCDSRELLLNILLFCYILDEATQHFKASLIVETYTSFIDPSPSASRMSHSVLQLVAHFARDRGRNGICYCLLVVGMDEFTETASPFQEVLAGIPCDSFNLIVDV